jgi:hypothetical protein
MSKLKSMPMPTPIKVALPTLAALALLLLWSRPAAAYPQFQFSSGTNRCGQCHVSPAGGGLLTSWGHDESADTISRGGDGSFLHGLWAPPSWLGIGGDFRFAGLASATGGPESPELVAFPMQLDIYLRAAFGDGFSLNVTIGDRGMVRPEDESFVGRVKATGDSFISREHYLMWRPSATGPYVRVGRFFEPYGLRMVEHIFYIERYTGHNLYEEPYTLSGGYIADDWEIHASAFVPVPTSFPDLLQQVGYREAGGALYGEKRFGGMASLGLQARAGVASDEARYQGGAVGKLWFEPAKMLLMGEADVIRQQIKGTGTGQTQFVSYIGPTFFPVRGLMAAVAYERYHEDVMISKTAHNAVDVEVNFFPTAHLELMLLGRREMNGDGAPASLGMLQIHYYL